MFVSILESNDFFTTNQQIVCGQKDRRIWQLTKKIEELKPYNLPKRILSQLWKFNNAILRKTNGRVDNELIDLLLKANMKLVCSDEIVEVAVVIFLLE